MVNGSGGYVKWEEIVVCKEKGRREVHYYLKDADGGMDLAIVGREKSARHMSYAMPAQFLQSCGADPRVRLPAVQQLSPTSSASCATVASPASTVSFSSPSPPPSSAPVDNLSIRWRSRREVIDWLSSAISDSLLASNPPDELCDGEDGCIADASVWKCSTHQSWLGSPWTCSKQRRHYNGIKISCIYSGPGQQLKSTESTASSGRTWDEVNARRKRTLISGEDGHKVKRLVGVHPCLAAPLPPKKDQYEKSQQFLLTTGQHVEVLSHDSGLRGCWFRCIVLSMHRDRIKVQYIDLQDADGSGPLEEWIRPPRTGMKDKLGIRVQDRSTIRPQPLNHGDSSPSSFNVGSIVDAWWHDGWWEGLVVSKDNHQTVRVFFPGEQRTCDFESGDLRHSLEWYENRWISLKERPDLASSLLSDGNGSSVPGDFLGRLKWNSSRKRDSRGLVRRRQKWAANSEGSSDSGGDSLGCLKFLLPPPLMEDHELGNLVVS